MEGNPLHNCKLDISKDTVLHNITNINVQVKTLLVQILQCIQHMHFDFQANIIKCFGL
jgi:hypothetical protein